MPHHKAWHEEKKRRRAALKRAEEEIDSRIEKIRMKKSWHERFDAEEEEGGCVPVHSGPLGVETEYISETGGGTILVEGGKPVTKSKAKAVAAAKQQEIKKSDLYEYRQLSREEKTDFKQQARKEEEKLFGRKRVQLGMDYKNHIILKLLLHGHRCHNSIVISICMRR